MEGSDASPNTVPSSVEASICEPFCMTSSSPWRRSRAARSNRFCHVARLSTYATYAVVRDNFLAARGLLAVAVVDRADLAPDPNSGPGEESFRLRGKIRPRLISIGHPEAVREVRGFARASIVPEPRTALAAD